MARKTAPEVKAFLASLPPGRREEFERVRDVIVGHLPKGYEEGVDRQMLTYQVPLSRCPKTYNGKPLWYAALANQKARISLHLMPIYADTALAAWLKTAFAEMNVKPDMGKGCIRFRRASDLPLDAIGEIIGALPVDRWIAIAQAAWTR